MSGSLYGPVATGEMEIEWFHNLFGDDFFLELQRHGMSEEQMRADGMDKEPWRLKLYQDTIAKAKRGGRAAYQDGAASCGDKRYALFGSGRLAARMRF